MHEPANATSNAYAVSQNVQQVRSAHRFHSIPPMSPAGPSFNPPMSYPTPAAVPASLPPSGPVSAANEPSHGSRTNQRTRLDRPYHRIDAVSRQPDLYWYYSSNGTTGRTEDNTLCGLSMELPENFDPSEMWRHVTDNISAHVENNLAFIQACTPDLSELSCPCPSANCCSCDSGPCDGGCDI